MIRPILLFFMLFFCGRFSAQAQDYIVFEDTGHVDTLSVESFKLLNTHIELSREGRPFHIFNFYFSKQGFRAYGLDRGAFTKAFADYRQIKNDVLVTLTPLTDSLEQKMKRLKADEVKGLHLVDFQCLLQNAIKNLHRSFSRNDIRQDDKPGIIKTTRYKMLIKRHGVYYKVEVPVLTEYYLIDKAGYLFPDGYHYGEINVMSPGQTKYVTGIIVDSILHQNQSGTRNGYFPIAAIAERTYLSACSKQDSCNIYTYWTYPVHLNGLLGVGRFQFIEGIGIVNGTYGSFFDKKFIMHLENNFIKSEDDYNGRFVMKLKSINGMPINKVCEKLYQTYIDHKNHIK
jgi:hypothetical protein